MSSNVTYHEGFVPINARLCLDNLVAELKRLLQNLHNQKQEVDGDDVQKKDHKQFHLLFFNLKCPAFLGHKNSLVKIIVACCIVELLHLSPFRKFKWNEIDLMVILEFFIKQLEYFSTSSDITFDYYEHFIKTLRKSEIFSRLFLLLKLEANKKKIYDSFLLTTFMAIGVKEDISMVKTYTEKLIQSFINHTKYISIEGVDIILYSILPENFEKQPALYNFGMKVIKNCSTTLTYPIKMLLFQELEQTESFAETRITDHEFEVMFELHHICPIILVGVWNQLEIFLLEKEHSAQKSMTLTVLAHLFAEENSDFAVKYRRLWNYFKMYMNEGSAFGQSLFAACASKFLTNQPNLYCEIVQIIKDSSLDRKSSVRFGVVKALNKATRKNIEVIKHSVLLDILKDRSCDTNEAVYKEALITLGLIYRRIIDGNHTHLMSKAAWIANTIMHMYEAPHDLNIYIAQIEKVILKCLVPCDLPPEQRMKKLLQLYYLFDTKSCINFHHYQELKKRACCNTLEFLSLYDQPYDGEESLRLSNWKKAMLAGKISLCTGNQEDSHRGLMMLAKELSENERLLNFLKEYLNENNSCENFETLWAQNRDILSYTSRSKKTLLNSKRKCSPSEEIVLTVKSLCAKVVSFLVDQAAMKELLKLVKQCATDDSILEEFSLNTKRGGKRGIQLLYEYFFVMPHLAYQDTSIIEDLLYLSTVNDHEYSVPVLKIFVVLSSYKPLNEIFPTFVFNKLIPLWHKFAISGTPQEAKLAVRCLCCHTVEDDINIISDILKEYSQEMAEDSDQFLTRIIALGHFATYLPKHPSKSCIMYITFLCHKYVQALIIEPSEDSDTADVEWCEKDNLPYRTRCKVEALKALTRLTITLCENAITEQTLNILSRVADDHDKYSKNRHLSTLTRTWLRLTAGCCFLKICDVPEIYTKQVPKIYFFKMAKLMNDKSKFVRGMFIKKLRKKLMQWGKQRYGLPSVFLSYFVLCGLEEDMEIVSLTSDVLDHCVQDKRLQVWSILCIGKMYKSLSDLMNRCQKALPDYCVQVALQMLARYVYDVNKEEVSVHRVHKCLTFFLTSFLNKKIGDIGHLTVDFYVKLFGKMKSYKNAVSPGVDDADLNEKIWSICEIGEYLMSTVDPRVNNDTQTTDPVIDQTFYRFYPQLNASSQYLTTNVERLLLNESAFSLPDEYSEEEEMSIADEERPSEQEVAVFYSNTGEYEIEQQAKRAKNKTDATLHRSDNNIQLDEKAQQQISRIKNITKRIRPQSMSAKKN